LQPALLNVRAVIENGYFRCNNDGLIDELSLPAWKGVVDEFQFKAL
jgi:hypothetical protein